MDIHEAQDHYSTLAQEVDFVLTGKLHGLPTAPISTGPAGQVAHQTPALNRRREVCMFIARLCHNIAINDEDEAEAMVNELMEKADKCHQSG